MDHARDRVQRLEKALDAAIAAAPASMRAVIEALQSMRGVSQLVAVTVVAEVGELSRFEHSRQLMGYTIPPSALCDRCASGKERPALQRLSDSSSSLARPRQ